MSLSLAEAFPVRTASSASADAIVQNRPRKRPWEERERGYQDCTMLRFEWKPPSTKLRSISTRLHLFFNKRDENGNIIEKPKKARPSAETLDELRSKDVTFPKEVHLDPSGAGDVSLTLRHMDAGDLKALVPMCIEEFGSYIKLKDLKSQKRALLPRWILDPKQIPDLWEFFSFEMLIYWTLRSKMLQGGNSRNDSSPPNDPVMLVLCEDWKGSKSTHPNSLGEESRVVGMVEMSLQPPDADRNPPAVPLPVWYKAAVARRTTMDGSLQGWVTNLLVDDSCRGRGYSKILMAAAEGIAQHAWGCTKVYLHADADVRSGKIPQSLYEGLGYDPVIGSTKRRNQHPEESEDPRVKYAWAGLTGKELERFSAVRMVDGVPLLCYSKRL